MIHVLDFEGKIIDYIDHDDLAVYKVLHKKSTETETLDIEIDSERAEHFKKRHRVIIKDKTDKYREFIIDRATEESGLVIVEATASYLVDLKNARPLKKSSFKNMGVNQKVSEVLKDSGWEVNNSVFAGITNTTWDKTIYANELLTQIADEHKVKYEFEVVVDGYEVTKRYVNIEEPVHLFKGREIVYGKDLESMKRSIDFTEVRTALYIVGPEEDKKPSKVTMVFDDNAQEQFGDSYHYIWDIYEPSDNVTADTSVEELKRLGKQELAKRNSAALSYELNVVDLEKEFPHEIINFGDIVRIKNPDFVPSLYAESEVIGIEYELISEECNYTFGNIVERKEDELLRYFRDRLYYINQKLNDGLTNVNTIVADTIANELQYVEKKIFKGSEPPENPVNDMLWLDTRNPYVAVLRRYWEGQWINATAEKAEDIGAITREKALYSELTNTFVNLSIQHSKLLNEMHDVMNSEYLVDFDLKDELNTKLDATVSIFNNIKSNLESMTDETATIGKLIDTQTLFLNYRTAMQNLYNVVERAKVAIDERFKLLQSQYTDEKFKEALNNVADKLGLTVNEDNQLVGEIDVSKQIDESVREMTNQMLRDYVTSSQYQSDQQGIIERLESSDSERKQLADRISDTVTKSEYQNDVEQKLSTTKAETLIEAEQTSNRVSKEVFNAKSKTLERYTSEFINNVSDGMTFRYDENGNIQSHSIGPQGIKIKGDKLDIQLNKEFNLLVSDVAKKADETNIINKINLSREGLDINVNNIGIRGGDSTNYLTIKNQEILSRGIFTRTWSGVTDTPTATVGIKDGYILSRNEKTGYNLYMTEKGLSTMMSGGIGSEQAGALEFHYDLMNDNSRGVRLSSTYGVVFLHSEHSRIYTRSRYTTNIESWESSIYLRPQVSSRSGVNEFSFYIKDNDSAGDTDGTILFGEISDETGLAGSGIRFKKKGVRGKSEDIYEPMVYATDNQGSIGTGSFYAKNLYGDWKAKSTNLYAMVNGEFRVTDFNGANGTNGRINYAAVRIGNINSYGSYANHSGANVYFGVGVNELRVTNNNHYNGGDIGYRPVRASAFNNASLAEYKEDIKLWDYDALNVITKELELYQYKYKGDVNNQLNHRGLVIGDGYKTPSEFIFGDGVNLYEMITWALRAIQQLNEKLEALQNE